MSKDLTRIDLDKALQDEINMLAASELDCQGTQTS